MKKSKTVVCKSTNKVFGTKKGRKGTVTETYYYNGETHYKGMWDDDKTSFDMPSVLLKDLK